MTGTSVNQVLELAIRKHGAGELKEAERLYRTVLGQQRNHADALHLLGVLLHQLGRTQEGIKFIRRAIDVDGRAAMYHSNLSNVYREAGQFTEAAASLRTACGLAPADLPLHLRLGVILHGRLDDPSGAADAFRKALAVDSQCGEAHAGLAVALHRLGDPAAMEHYKTALRLQPTDAELLSNFAMALGSKGEYERGTELMQRAVQLKPQSGAFWFNLGVMQMGRQQHAKAIAAFKKAIEINPNDTFSHINLAAMLRNEGRLEEAAGFYRRLVAEHPEMAQLHNNLGLVLLGQGRHDQAVQSLRRAIEIDARCPTVYDNLLMTLHYSTNDAASLFADHRAWAKLEEQVPAAVYAPRADRRRLRIGYVSPDFREHSVMFFIEPILARHDRENFEVFCYANQPIADGVTTRLRRQADHWRDIYRISDAEADELIRRDEIDILVDLAVHTQGNRLTLFARKPAPLQGTYLGYASTTGLSTIDFRITDPWVDPAGLTDAFHSEKLMRLPQTQWVYRPVADTPEVSPLPARKGRLTFGAATNLAKISEPTIEMWAMALRAVPNATLILKGAGMEDEPTRQFFLDRFAHAGIRSDRLVLEPTSPLAKYLHWFSEVDLVLDTSPFAGGTTSCHSLYMGAPVITRIGNTSVSRVGSSLLHNLGLKELIAETAEQFARIVADLSSDLPRLASLRESLRPRMQQSPLMDEASFARNLESAYQQAWAQR